MTWTRVNMVAKVTTSAYLLISDDWKCHSRCRELSKAVEQYIKQEDEGRFRCKTCQKLFKATSFVEKHVANKHPELVKQLDEVRMFNLVFFRHLTVAGFSGPLFQ